MANEIDQVTTYTYGTRGGSNRYRYKLDNKARKIHLEGDIPDKVVLTYISSGIDNATTNYIPIYMEKVLEAYLDWQLSENNPQAHLGDRDRKQRNYFDALREAKKFEAPPLGDILDSIRKSMSQSIRR